MEKQIINVKIGSLRDFRNRVPKLDEEIMDLIMSPSDGMDLPVIEVRVELSDPKNFSLYDVSNIENTDFGLTANVIVINKNNSKEQIMEKRVFMDAGLTGAICVTYDNAIFKTYRMPTMDNKKKELDHARIKEIIEGASLVVVEEQFIPHETKDKNGKAFNQQGMSTNMMNFGILLGLGFLDGKQARRLLPKKWKAYHGLMNSAKRSKYLPKITKASSVELVNKKYGLGLPKSLDGVADAILIAEYAIYKLNGSRKALEHNMTPYTRGAMSF